MVTHQKKFYLDIDIVVCIVFALYSSTPDEISRISHKQT
jgi:hypothetical protein